MENERMSMFDCCFQLAELFKFKEIFDKNGNEFVLLEDSCINHIDQTIEDKTAFEATENHFHLIEKLSVEEFFKVHEVATMLGRMMYWSLQFKYPAKRFVVYVTAELNDSLTIRFHQVWDGEQLYFSLDGWDPSQTVIVRVDTKGCHSTGDGLREP